MFKLGLAPRVFVTGAVQISCPVGAAVFSGMIAASLIGILLILMLYVVFECIRERPKRCPAAVHRR